MNDEPGGPDSSFEERLKAARGRRGLDAPSKRKGFDPNRVEQSPVGIGLRVGIELVSALVVAVAIGYGLDWVFGTRPIFIALFVPLGGAAGVWNIWRLFAPKPGQG